MGTVGIMVDVILLAGFARLDVDGVVVELPLLPTMYATYMSPPDLNQQQQQLSLF